MTYLDDAIKEFVKYSAEDPFNTWLITDNSDGIRETLKNSKTAVLTRQITNLSDFATAVVSAVFPKKKILKKSEQFIIFSDIANKSRLVSDDIHLPLSTVADLMEIYKQFHWAGAELIDISEYVGIIKEIIDEYEFWANEHDCLDYISVVERAMESLKRGKYSVHKIILAMDKPQNPFMKKFYETIQDTLPCIKISADPLSTPKNITCFKYSSEKTEIEHVLNKAAELLETGTDSKDILIISPSITETENLVRELIKDFYYIKEDGTIHTLDYISSNAGPSTAQYPYIQAVLSALACVAKGYNLEDLETVLSSPYLQKKEIENLTSGTLHHISSISNVRSDKKEWLKLTETCRKENGFKRFTKEIDDIPKLIEWLEPLSLGTTYGEFAESCLKWLTTTGWTITDIPEEHPRKSFLSLLQTITDSIVGEKKCTIRDFYYQILRFNLEKVESVRSKNPDAIRLAGIRVAHHIPAKHVFLVSMNSESIPHIATKLPPMSEEDTKSLLIFFVPDQYTSEETYMNTAVGAATESLQISYAETAGTKAKTPSKFLRSRGNLIEVRGKELKHSITWNQKRAGAALLSGAINNISPVGLTDSEKLIKRADGENTGSVYKADFPEKSCFPKLYNETTKYTPTDIEVFLRCPYQWFIRKYMNLYNPYDETSEASKLGDVIHDSLQRFFKKYTKKVTSETRTEALQTLYSIAENEFERKNMHSPSWEAKKKFYLGKSRHTSPLEAFISLEIELQENGWRTTGELTETVIDGTISTNDGKCMKFNGRIDRVMENDSNQFQIVDYKAGHSFNYKNDRNIQVALYAKAYQEATGKMVEDGYYLKMDKITKKGRLESKGKLNGKGTNNPHPPEERIEEALSLSFDAIEKMNKGYCIPREDCKEMNCKYRYLCHKAVSDEESGEVNE